MPCVKGSTNISVCLKQILIGAASSPSPQSSAVLQYTHTQLPQKLWQHHTLFNVMNAAHHKGAARSGTAPGEVSPGHSPTPTGCSATDTRREGQGGRQHRVLSTAQWSSGNHKAASQQQGQGRKSMPFPRNKTVLQQGSDRD